VSQKSHVCLTISSFYYHIDKTSLLLHPRFVAVFVASPSSSEEPYLRPHDVLQLTRRARAFFCLAFGASSVVRSNTCFMASRPNRSIFTYRRITCPELPALFKLHPRAAIALLLARRRRTSRSARTRFSSNAARRRATNSMTGSKPNASSPLPQSNLARNCIPRRPRCLLPIHVLAGKVI
jgi:hypothetical protein